MTQHNPHLIQYNAMKYRDHIVSYTDTVPYFVLASGKSFTVALHSYVTIVDVYTSINMVCVVVLNCMY